MLTNLSALVIALAFKNSLYMCQWYKQNSLARYTKYMV